MDNLLLKYMEGRFQESSYPETWKPNPFVTLSREFGCPSKIIAKMLAQELNRETGNVKERQWQYINKEIVEQAAKELELEPFKIEHLFKMDQTGIMDDLLSSFSSNYKSSLKIRKTIRDLIQSFSQRGYVILVGRGGIALTHNRPNSLHIRLQAPLDWRTKCFSESHGIPVSEALNLALETDKKRTALIESFLGYKLEPSLFDVVFNCKTLSNQDIVSSIIKMMEIRKMIQ
jgi:cytidylate kinase